MKTFELENLNDDYWASVTDVACPSCHHGIIRWAEAGYVPGYRICDTCQAHYRAIGDANNPAVIMEEEPTVSVTPDVIAAALEEREKIEATRIESETKRAREMGTHDAVTGGGFGDGWCHITASLATDDDTGQFYWLSWDDAAPDSAVEARRLVAADLFFPGEGIGGWGFPFRPQLTAISHDGSRVMVYRDGSGGTYEQSMDDALAGRVINADDRS